MKNKKVEGNILIDGSSTSIKDDKQNNYSTHSNIGENIINNSNVNNINNNNNNNKLIINDNKDKIINQNKLNKIKKKELLFKKNDLINKSSSYENNSKELIINNIKLNRNSINNDNILHNRANLLKEEESNRPIINVSAKSEHNEDIQEININNSINLDILNHKKYLIKDTEFIIIEKKPFNMNNISFFYEYLRKREICLITFLNKRKTIPYFIRYSIFLISLSFIFLINCFFFNESMIHERYLYSLNGGESNNISYYFRKEFKISVYSALIGNIIKMILIKSVMNYIFEINEKDKILINNSYEAQLNEEKLEDLKTRKEKYIKNYIKNYRIYLICVVIINIIIGYICTCYGGVFPNSYTYFICGFLFSFIMSIIICIFLCFIIVILYIIGKAKNNFCTLSAYITLSKLY